MTKLQLQTVIIPKTFGMKDAKKWINDHNYKVKFYGKHPDVTTNFIRFRQDAPSNFISKSYKTIKLSNGILLVYGEKK